MFQNYQALESDLEAVKQALDFAVYPKMKFVFSDFSRIAKTLTISYDNKFIYIWQFGQTKPLKAPHSLNIADEWQRAWWATPISDLIVKIVPKARDKPIINGGLITPFIALQKLKEIKDNPYITKESYLATIIHELGHIYFGGYGKKGELSATCTEYYASTLFWPKHVKNLNKFVEKINKSTPFEEKDQHIFALLNAKKTITQYPKSWPSKLLKNYLG